MVCVNKTLHVSTICKGGGRAGWRGAGRADPPAIYYPPPFLAANEMDIFVPKIKGRLRNAFTSAASRRPSRRGAPTGGGASSACSVCKSLMSEGLGVVTF
ncbi:hypothetical protein EVAR_48059_1 [Eumeta japonica]|uniref:Uncharacterized protein n=1 Tax=Eumeta variegata TaxID=151549 RepID=A0A4C1X9Q5_EUMVA|nr:hypothetical protein EVAR_48059_1 [Eumeta japonica]